MFVLLGILVPHALTWDNYIIATFDGYQVFLTENSMEHRWNCFGDYCNRDINQMNISRLPDSTFPENLQQANEITATGLKLKYFHFNAFHNQLILTSLNVSHNLITIPPLLLPLNLLKTLDLSFNRISQLNEGYFYGLNLESIFLHGNRLVQIDPTIFRIESLKTLTLNDNKLTAFSMNLSYEDDFMSRSEENDYYIEKRTRKSHKIVPHKVILVRNQLENDKEIQVNAKYVDASFTGAESCVIFPETEIFIATNNFIQDVKMNNSYLRLRELYLSYNNISSVEFMNGANVLEVVDLSNNQITSFYVNNGYLMLRKLILSNNNILEFGYLSLVSSHMNFIDLSNNNLHGEFRWNISADALTQLNISNNNLTSIQENLMDFIPSLEKINFNGNRLKCDKLKDTMINLLWNNILIETSARNEDSNVHGVDCVVNTTDDNPEAE